MRKEYEERGLDESQIDASGTPFELFRSWYDEAVANKIAEPSAMCLSTITKEGKPASRYMLMKQFNSQDGSFVFITYYNSPKSWEIAHNPYASIVFYWGDMGRSVRIEGRVEKVSDEENDLFFSKRSRDEQIGAWSSHQSNEI